MNPSLCHISPRHKDPCQIEGPRVGQATVGSISIEEVYHWRARSALHNLPPRHKDVSPGHRIGG